MSETVLVAMITAGAGVLCQLIIAGTAKHKQAAADAAKEQRLSDRLETIERKLDEHNGYAQKFAETSGSIIRLQKDVEYLKEAMNR